MVFTQNVNFVTTIDTAVKAIMADGKIDKNDIPRIVLLITELITSSGTKVPVTTEQMKASINSLFNYIMTHYKLFPDDPTEQTDCKQMFDMCVKLALFQPNISKVVKKVFACC